MKYQVGDRVWWTSQAAGYSKEKHGVVVAVVPPREPPCFVQRPKDCYVRVDQGTVRPHESYLVRVGRRVRLYWPRVKDLLSDGEVRP